MNDPITYRLLKKVLFFIIIVLVINTTISWVYNRKIAVKGLMQRTDIKYRQNVKNSNVLFMGHSRIRLGIDEKFFDRSFNYASFGESNVYTYYKLKNTLNQHDQQVKTVIIPYGFSSFFSFKNPAIADHAYWNRYLDYTELGNKHGKIDEYLSLWLQSKYVPYSRFARIAIDKKINIFKRSKIRLEEFATEKAKYAYAIDAIEYNLPHRNHYDNISYEYLKKALDLCESKNIRVIGLKCPITSYYYKAYQELIDSKQWNDSNFYELLKKHKVELVDFEKTYFSRDDLFKDTHHLNEKGRQQLSIDVKQYFENNNLITIQ